LQSKFCQNFEAVSRRELNEIRFFRKEVRGRKMIHLLFMLLPPEILRKSFPLTFIQNDEENFLSEKVQKE